MWINLTSRASEEYINGVTNFLDFAFAKLSEDGKIWCPCVKCVNTYRVSRREAFDHIICDGFLKGYVRWIFHGKTMEVATSTVISNEEEIVFDNDIHELLHDMMAEEDMNADVHIMQSEDSHWGQHYTHRIHSDNFYNLLKDAKVELYPGCKNFTKFSFAIYLFHIKCFNGWTNKSFSALLELLKLVLPEGNTLPRSYQELKKMISALSLGYEKIHACPNDCILFWKENANEDKCTKCGASRWKENLNVGKSDSEDAFTKKKKKAAKILQWFPLIPRLQRLFMSSKTASLMTWHEHERTKDGCQRHSADSQSWKELDSRYPQFSSDPRSVQLGLASDGFNPFKTMTIVHSAWHVILIPYNLPLWMCMKQSNFILSLLIPGSKRTWKQYRCILANVD
ncbi:uncharacterized protein LOC120276106 [Dioscorea cayenensis subsp. rotundata]|uniref:Uncharacterized protein LOC120276106 n=1 Tax=Dioscorea cayennensis subsp. rotundata TaxID=55577 RepID=A0AB40CH85_DIOCR|nr:uncharacterized protein LOC120276106 [Dioscorea cayenensis subsp. rotundata]